MIFGSMTIDLLWCILLLWPILSFSWQIRVKKRWDSECCREPTYVLNDWRLINSLKDYSFKLLRKTLF